MCLVLFVYMTLSTEECSIFFSLSNRIHGVLIVGLTIVIILTFSLIARYILWWCGMNLVIQASLDIGHWMCIGWSQTCRVGLIHFMA